MKLKSNEGLFCYLNVREYKMPNKIKRKKRKEIWMGSESRWIQWHTMQT